MGRLISSLLTLVIFAAIILSAYWIFTVPQPPRTSAQIQYLKDEAIFKATFLKDGEPVYPKDQLTAFRPLADEGNLVAQLRMAQILFVQGNTDPKAYADGVKLLRHGVDMGIPLAQNAYGVALRDGLGGLAVDKIEAYKWFSLAADRGYQRAQENALQLSHNMAPPDVIEAEHRADAWLLDYMSKP